MTKQVMQVVGWPKKFQTLPNSCNVNRYDTGKDFVGWHSDDEKLFSTFNDQTMIVSLSLGASRTFEIRHKSSNKEISIVLNNGDI